MATLKVNTVSGIGTEGVVLDGGLKFRSLNYMTLPKGDTNQRDNDGGGRGVFGGGEVPGSPGVTDTIDYVEFTSNSNAIDFVTISTTRNATDFGDTTSQRQQPAGASNQTRGIVVGGKSPASNTAGVNTIEFITIASTGDGQDFGDLLAAQAGHFGLSSPTRAIFAGGYTPTQTNVIQYVTIDTTGDATDFGDLKVARGGGAGGASNTRGLFHSGSASPGLDNTIDFVTIATTGDAIDFGDAVIARGEITGCCSDSTRGVFSGGHPNTNAAEKVTIATTGTAGDFGDLTVARRGTTSLSDSHGGLAE